MWLNYTGLCNTFHSLPALAHASAAADSWGLVRQGCSTWANLIRDHSEPQPTRRNTHAGSCSLPRHHLDTAFPPNAILLLPAAQRALLWPQLTGAAEQDDLGYVYDVLCRTGL